MIVFHEERIVPTDVNVLVFAGANSSGYFYVHRNLYDQAVVISHLYDEDITKLCEELGGSSEMRDDVEYFYQMTPSPIRALAPFLLLVKENVDNYVDMVGAIHVMSTQFDLLKMISVPESVRASLKFNLRITEEYQLAWDRFIGSSMTYSKPVLLPPYASQISLEGTPVSRGSGYNDDDDDDEDLRDPNASPEEQQELDELAELMMIMGAPTDQIKSVRRGEAIITDEGSTVPLMSDLASGKSSASAAAVAMEDDPEPEEEEAEEEEEVKPKELTGLDLVRSFA